MASIMEGPLSKWTNVMKGWQYRWFVLDYNAGLLSYYTVRCRVGRAREGGGGGDSGLWGGGRWAANGEGGDGGGSQSGGPCERFIDGGREAFFLLAAACRDAGGGLPRKGVG